MSFNYPFLGGFDRCVTNIGHVKSDRSTLINRYFYKYIGHLVRQNLKVKIHL